MYEGLVKFHNASLFLSQLKPVKGTKMIGLNSRNQEYGIHIDWAPDTNGDSCLRITAWIGWLRTAHSFTIAY